jgi:hypothetical protein
LKALADRRRDVRAIHNLIITSDMLEPIGQEGMQSRTLRSVVLDQALSDNYDDWWSS